MQQSTHSAKPRRERPKAIKLTDAAAARIRDIIRENEKEH